MKDKVSAKLLTITADSANGEFLHPPKKFTVSCSDAVPEGENIVRNFNEFGDITARKLFLIRVGLDVFGTTQFATKYDFFKYKNNQCDPCAKPTGCGIYVNGILVSINGCKVLNVI